VALITAGTFQTSVARNDSCDSTALKSSPNNAVNILRQLL
jgi:hypothetical protein